MIPISKKILIADDEKPLAHALELKLTHSGYDAKAVNNGLEAIEALQKEKFDLLILDLVMPKLDGFGVLAELKNKKINIPVIVSSNLSQDGDIKRAQELGIKHYFIKSDTPIANIVIEVENALNEK